MRNTSLPTSVVAGSNRKVWWLGECGHEWEVSPTARAYRSESGCPYCDGKKVFPGFNDLATVNPEVAAEWHPEKNGDVTPQMVAPNSNKRRWWECKLGHEWRTNPLHRSQGTGCPDCTNRRLLTGFNDLATRYPAVAKEWHPAKNEALDPEGVLYGSGTTVWWRCEDGHDFERTVAARTALFERTGATTCPVCHPPRESAVERAIRDALRESGEVVATSGKLPVPWGKRRTAACDIVLTERRCVVEYDGAYWHIDRSDRDATKTLALLEAGWSVIRIREIPLPDLEIEDPAFQQLVADPKELPRAVAARVQGLLPCTRPARA